MTSIHKRILIGLAVVLGVILTASLTVYILRSVNQDSQVNPQPNNDTEESTTPTIKEIDPGKNDEAMKAESDAKQLMESDPQKAAIRYEEASNLYKEAGDYGKSADMADSARTAESMTPSVEPEFGEPVISR